MVFFLKNEVDSEKSGLTKAQITIADCLACSGCVTSAETVLVTQQSVVEFEKCIAQKASDHNLRIAVTISSQAVASLAAHFGWSSRSTLRKLVTFLKTEAQVDYVFDLRTSQSLSVYGTLREFIQRKANSEQGGSLPMLCGACPGWVCYAEKVHSHLLPNMSRIRSAQQIQGALLKRCFGKVGTLSLLHFAIMSCYDKKLEATRADFAFTGDSSETSSTKEVDCVLTSGELLELLAKRAFAIERCAEQDCDDLLDFLDSPELPDSVKVPQGGWLVRGKSNEETNVRQSIATAKALRLAHAAHVSSGGYANYVLKLASQYYGLTELEQPTETVFTPKRNLDFQECVVTRRDVSDDAPKQLCFAFAYGLRNIQNVVQALKRAKQNDYDYIEVMACPNGCLNGGGQVKPQTAEENAKSRLADVQRVFTESLDSNSNCGRTETSACGSNCCACSAPDSSVSNCKETSRSTENDYWHAVEVLYSALAECFTETALFLTDYHAVEKTVQPLMLKW